MNQTGRKSTVMGTREALRVGYERLLGWAEVLDQINVFPVPDGDTGRNLVMSLAPLRDCDAEAADLDRRLLLSARGNSGNIAVEFVRQVVDSRTEAASLSVRFAAGAQAARKAVAKPEEGTMLTALDALANATREGFGAENVERILSTLGASVRATREQLEPLRNARVVDSGALGILLLLDGFLRALFGCPVSFAIEDDFRDLVRFRRGGVGGEGRRDGEGVPRLHEPGCCIDAVLRLAAGRQVDERALATIGRDVITLVQGDLLKVHLHAHDEPQARAELARMGEIVRWSWDDWEEQSRRASSVTPEGGVHVMTDAASSLTRRDAEALGVTLLDSYVTLDGESLPETLVPHERVYSAMRHGVHVTTAQASSLERTQHYERIARHHDKTLYLCVGSAYTGIYSRATSWVREHGAGDRMSVVDSGAASGRLAVTVWDVARRAGQERSLPALAAYAERALGRAEEYVFLDKLTYLAQGGRVTKTSAIFADLVGVAPVITPMPDGVRKVGLFRKIEQKVAFACERLTAALAASGGRGLILLEYSDNRAWVESELEPRVRAQLPLAECHIRPLSLTSGVHMGPGTWAAAVIPSEVA